MDKNRMWLMLLAALLFSFVSTTQVDAQAAAERLTALSVEIWPDFDQPAALILLTGELPANTFLPATIMLPIPVDATVNAVARIAPDGGLYDDIAYERNGELLLVNSTELRFRVEYYLPYQQTGDERRFSYVAPDTLAIERLDVSVQEPAGATTFQAAPHDATVIEDAVGLRYYTYPNAISTPVTPFRVEVSFRNPTDALTADFITERDGAAVGSGAVTVPTTAIEEPTSSINWPLIIIGGFGLAVSIYFLGSGLWEWSQARKKRQRRRPARQRQAKKTKAVASAANASALFCHSCGKQASQQDKFCRQCGTALKGR